MFTFPLGILSAIQSPHSISHTKMGSLEIPQTQTVALVRNLGGEVEFKTDYPVPNPGRNEVLAKVLYTGVCQSGMSFLFEPQIILTESQIYTPSPVLQPDQMVTPSRRSSYRMWVDTRALAVLSRSVRILNMVLD